MKKRENLSVAIVTCWIVVYCVLLLFEENASYAIVMLTLFPLLMFWMIYQILKHGKYKGPELKNDEFGYQDKDKNELAVF